MHHNHNHNKLRLPAFPLSCSFLKSNYMLPKKQNFKTPIYCYVDTLLPKPIWYCQNSALQLQRQPKQHKNKKSQNYKRYQSKIFQENPNNGDEQREGGGGNSKAIQNQISHWQN